MTGMLRRRRTGTRSRGEAGRTEEPDSEKEQAA